MEIIESTLSLSIAVYQSNETRFHFGQKHFQLDACIDETTNMSFKKRQSITICLIKRESLFKNFIGWLEKF